MFPTAAAAFLKKLLQLKTVITLSLRDQVAAHCSSASDIILVGGEADLLQDWMNKLENHVHSNIDRSVTAPHAEIFYDDKRDLFGKRRRFLMSRFHYCRDQSAAIRGDLDSPGVLTSGKYRNEKLSRYRMKKGKRNFVRRIKYACRKALADSQPRIRGRFAKTEEVYGSKREALNVQLYE
nr:zinc finger protein CONSTANS-LIKE 1 isoform X2 [Ipomoea batatas]